MNGYADFFAHVDEAAAYVSEKVSARPKLMVALTAGLDAYAEGIEDSTVVEYADIPHFGATTAEGHRGKLIFGQRAGVAVVAMQGRFHFYEGHHPAKVIMPYFVIQRMGARIAITTNAVGGIRIDMNPGDVMLVTDHLNLMGMNPLVGIATQRGSDQFTGMADAYDGELADVARRSAAMNGIELKEGVFAAVTGPTYETKAEIKMLRVMGADAVGMSTVPDVIAARFLGMRVLTFCIVANAAADRHEGELKHEEVLHEVAAASPKVVQLLNTVTNEISKKVV